ncbi:MAG TPA: PilZ domain-containing protein, partial [Pirellulales bacterium]|nr:PilZ domain-containing protein [Pirellulales bacterium]
VDQKIVDAIHKRLEAGKVETPNDRRQRARSPLNGIQRIAPCKQGTTPADMKFQNVRCKDISSGGIGFYFPQPPDFETVIVALGSEPNCTYLHARVMHCRPIPPEHGPGFLIGCQFIGRALI